MQRRECSVWMGVALGAMVLLSGCGGLEKGPAPSLPYTPEPPVPKTEKKADVPKGLGPSTPVPIKIETPAVKKDGAAAKEQTPTPEAKKDDAPKADEKKPAEPAKAVPAKKDAPEPKKE